MMTSPSATYDTSDTSVTCDIMKAYRSYMYAKLTAINTI